MIAYTVLTAFLNLFSGYDTGVISGALVSIGSDLGPAELSSGQKVSVLHTDDTEYVAEAEEAAVSRNS